MLLKLAKELTRKEKEERKQLPLNCSPTQLIEKNSRRSCNVGYFFLQDIYYSLGLKDICDKISHGIYAKHHKQEKHLRKCISAEKQRFLRSVQDWRHSILLSFGYDPLCCSECGTSMLVLEVYHKKTTLFEQYRKVMGYG